jgi:hypothetical protein
LKREGILYVFLTFQTAGLAEKIRRSAQTQLCGAAFVQFSESVKELCVIDKNDAFYGAETIDSHKEMC